jgi:hypothetical protein
MGVAKQLFGTTVPAWENIVTYVGGLGIATYLV